MFDGLHRGHVAVLEALAGLAARLGGESVVVTFDTHPMAVITGAPPRPILSLEQRLRLLEAHGVDAVVVLPFDAATRATTYEDFVTHLLVGRLGMVGLLFGYNSNFGHGGRGTIATVGPLGRRLGFEVVEAPAFLLDGRPVSSTRIRDAIEGGDLAEAKHLLGRPVTLEGRVLRGDGRGRTLGFPTANVDTEGALAPPSGVYEVRAHIGATAWCAVANLGVRPTIPGATPQGSPLLEVHIPGFSGDLYGERVRVEFVRRLRDEQRFASLEALAAQIRRDVAAVLGPS
jgi:riboflavin kinase/FMN adenylyltransferase